MTVSHFWRGLGERPGGCKAPGRSAPAHRPDAAAAVARFPPPGLGRARVRPGQPADHGGGAVPGVPADPLVTLRRAGVRHPAVSPDRRVTAGWFGGRRDGPAPTADDRAGTDG